jgi:hypothetical protein
VAAGAAPALSHFRLVAEAPAGAPALGEVFGAGRGTRGTPYKLFEVVPGAEIVMRCAPASEAGVRIAIDNGHGRRFEWAARTETDAEGWARLRVPYATQSAQADVRPGVAAARGALRANCGGFSRSVEVPLEAVRNGETIEVVGLP